MRIATWNIEWFEALFDTKDRLLADDQPSSRYKVSRRRQAESIALVFDRMEADIVLIIEAPNTGHTQSSVRALESFAGAYGLRQSRAITGFPSPTHQEISALYDPDRATLRHDPQESARAPRFDLTYRMDTDADAQAEEHVFSKPPLELSVDGPDLPGPIRLIGVHAKSKNPSKARGEAEILRQSILNRRKQLAQCVWIRARIDDHLDRGEPVIVAGDLNDGPGLDGFEGLFGRSSVEVLLGDPAAADRVLTDPHAGAALNPRQGWTLATARFYNRDYQMFVNALLDYMMLSPDLVDMMRPRWRIWHPFDDPRIYRDADLRDALLDASDHFPVSVDLG